MTSCCHLFCENCIKQWLNKSKVCPVCRGVVQKVYHCPTFDGFLTNIYDNLGGIIKEQRVNLQHESKGLIINYNIICCIINLITTKITICLVL